MKTKLDLFIGIGLLLLASLACNASFTTANLSEVKFGKNEKANPATDSFKPEDKIYIVSAVNNTSDKHKVRFRMMFDDVKGQKSGTVIPGSDKEMEIEGSSSVFFTASIPKFPAGRYKAEIVLLDADGKKEIDRKEGTFNFTGATTATTSKTEDEPSSTDEDDNSEATRKTDSTSATRKTDSTSAK